jgi:hypothetical protein
MVHSATFQEKFTEDMALVRFLFNANSNVSLVAMRRAPIFSKSEKAAKGYLSGVAT